MTTQNRRKFIGTLCGLVGAAAIGGCGEDKKTQIKPPKSVNRAPNVVEDLDNPDNGYLYIDDFSLGGEVEIGRIGKDQDGNPIGNFCIWKKEGKTIYWEDHTDFFSNPTQGPDGLPERYAVEGKNHDQYWERPKVGTEAYRNDDMMADIDAGYKTVVEAAYEQAKKTARAGK